METRDTSPYEYTYSEKDVEGEKRKGAKRLMAVLSSIPLTREVIGKILDHKDSDLTTLKLLLNRFEFSNECVILIAQKCADGQHGHLEGSWISWYKHEQFYSSPDVMKIFANSSRYSYRKLAAESPATDEETLEKLSEDEERFIAEAARKNLKKRRNNW